MNPLPTSGTIEYTTNIEDKLFLGLPWKNSQQNDLSGIFASLFSWSYHVSVDSVSERSRAVFICNTKAFRCHKYSN